MRELADIALDMARSKGASYADIRISRRRSQNISARERKIRSISDTETFGFGVRVLVDGTWGFAASHQVTKEDIQKVAARAVAIARANRRGQVEPVVLPPVPAYLDHWQSPIEKDPFKIPIEKKVELLFAVNEAALKVKGAAFVNSSLVFLNEWKYFASTDGSYIEQNIFRSWPSLTVTAIDRSRGQFQTRTADTMPAGLGYEHVERANLLELAPQVAEEAVAKLSAKPVEPGKYDLILHPSNLWLTIHESVGHPTELDRALGYEANYAGTSFLTVDKLGKLQFGSPIVNILADKTIRGGLATCGYDDDGVKTKEWFLIKDGVFVDYQITREQVNWKPYREARKAAGLPEVNESHGTAYADRWSSVPFQRMPNVHLVAGTDPLTLDELIADTKDGILIIGDGSYSIDQQRYNFQFGGQVFWEIKNGKKTQMLRDVAYQANTQEFWNSCDAICDERSWEMGGSYYDGKGQPGQVNAVSHGCSPARFRQINVLNTGRKV
jgi:TldD protein